MGENRSKGEDYLDELLRNVDSDKTDSRSDLPKKKEAPGKGSIKKEVKEPKNELRDEEESVMDTRTFSADEDDLDREIRQRLGRRKAERKRGGARRSRGRKEADELSGRDMQDGFSESGFGFSEDEETENKDFSAESIADSLLDVLSEDDDILAMTKEGKESAEDDFLAEDSGETMSEDDDILAMLAGDEASAEDDFLAEDGGEAMPEEDDILAMLAEDGMSGEDEASVSNDGDAPADELVLDEGSGEISDDDLMALLADDGGDPSDELVLEEGSGEELVLDETEVSEDDLMALMDDGEGGDAMGEQDDIDAIMGILDGDEASGPDIDGEDGDIFSLDDLMDDSEGGQNAQKDSISDMGDIISDSLSAVSSGEEDSLEAQILESVTDKKAPKKKGKFSVLMKKFFGNIVDSKSKKQFEEEKAEEEKAEFKKSEKARIKAGNLTEEEQKAKDAKEAAAAQAKEEKKQKKLDKKAAADAKKAEKLEKKKKLAEERKAEEALSVDEGRINRAGASIVFIFFALIAVAILIGSNQFTYATSIKKAGNYFDKQKYNKAYNEVSGLKIRDRDEEIYSKIMTVMYVNKELNSYNNYYDIQHYSEALDSLLKGLKRYDKYISDARELGIESDLDYVRKQILAELKRTYQISESEAVALNEIKDRNEYSEKVINTAEAAVGK